LAQTPLQEHEIIVSTQKAEVLNSLIMKIMAKEMSFVSFSLAVIFIIKTVSNYLKILVFQIESNTL